MSEEHNLFKRDDLLECFRSTADFTPIEAAFVKEARWQESLKRLQADSEARWQESPKRLQADSDFADALTIETRERQRNMRNMRNLLRDPEAWR